MKLKSSRKKNEHLYLQDVLSIEEIQMHFLITILTVCGKNLSFGVLLFFFSGVKHL